MIIAQDLKSRYNFSPGPDRHIGAVVRVRLWPEPEPPPIAGRTSQDGLAHRGLARLLHVRHLRMHPPVRDHAQQTHGECQEGRSGSHSIPTFPLSLSGSPRAGARRPLVDHGPLRHPSASGAAVLALLGGGPRAVEEHQEDTKQDIRVRRVSVSNRWRCITVTTFETTLQKSIINVNLDVRTSLGRIIYSRLVYYSLLRVARVPLQESSNLNSSPENSSIISSMSFSSSSPALLQ